MTKCNQSKVDLLHKDRTHRRWAFASWIKAPRGKLRESASNGWRVPCTHGYDLNGAWPKKHYVTNWGWEHVRMDYREIWRRHSFIIRSNFTMSYTLVFDQILSMWMLMTSNLDCTLIIVLISKRYLTYKAKMVKVVCQVKMSITTDMNKDGWCVSIPTHCCLLCCLSSL